MSEKAEEDVPAGDPFEPLRLELAHWRSAHPPRSRLPESIWAAAVRLTREHGLYRTARTLRLDYAHLKKKAQTDRPAAPANFVELIAPAVSMATDCIIEVEGARRGKMRIQTKIAPAELAALVRAWRDAEA